MLRYFSADEEGKNSSDEQKALSRSANSRLEDNVDKRKNALDRKPQKKSASCDNFGKFNDAKSNIITKILQGEKTLQHELNSKLNLIAMERKRIYEEKFTILKQNSEEKAVVDRQCWQYFATIEGSAFDSTDIVELHQKLKEMEGELKRSKLRYNVLRELSLKYKKFTALKKLSDKEYLCSLLNSMRKNGMADTADDLERIIRQYDRRLLMTKDEKSSNLSKGKLPKLTRRSKQRRKSIRLLDVSRPFTFSYFPEIITTPSEDKAKKARKGASKCHGTIQLPKL